MNHSNSHPFGAQLTITRPDDWHVHLRDGPTLAAVVPDTVQRFARALVMPNLVPPVTTVAAAAAYRHRILAAVPTGQLFEPLMTLYLTDATSPEEIIRARSCGFIHAVKLYPAGATTHAQAGVTNIALCDAALEAMQSTGLPLAVHGEVTDPTVDIFDREAVFIERVLQPLMHKFPGLKIVFEHITTREAVDFVRSAPSPVAATITAHHLLFNRNAIFVGGIRPHHYCLPVLKREQHRQALLSAATSGNPKFFLGTDSAPHARLAKESACGCAGCYTACAAIELYTQAFDHLHALDKLEGFASHYGADFYGLPRNTTRITLQRLPWTVPAIVSVSGGEQIVPLCAGEQLNWRLCSR
jgi:dihydroorotase